MTRQIGYAVYCRDRAGPEAGRIREEKMQQHLAYIEACIDKILIAGPLLEGEEVVGSLLIYKCDTPQAARELAQNDPYGQAGIWESMTVEQFVGAAGDWVGGKTW